ncbi:MAG: lipoyl(octanoyl) transferase LipB [Rhodocyclaceae bacterium]|nr:lipoyl(octanoyl) transferase LipB [Rhodocyclaceae bacterium]
MSAPLARRLGRVDYEPTFRAMQDFTAQRSAATPDEIWLCEHPPVFTLGLAGKPEHLLRDIGIPVVRIDRGGQITYHGPGQIVAYLLLDLKRRKLMVRELVHRMEQALIDLLADYGIAAARLAGAPGVYVGGAKIGALGLRVKSGYCYHGLALNVDMDLAPYTAINPCGYEGMPVTQMKELCAGVDGPSVAGRLLVHLNRMLET